MTYAKEKNYNIIYVMTDTDCNIDFYPKNGFHFVDNKKIKFNYDKLLELNCYLYDKEIY